MDLFLNRLRGEPAMTHLMAASPKAYTLFGILRTESRGASANACEIRPVVALPGLDPRGLAQVEKFETENRLLA
jgi:hypothetical protein